jgi:hypothetical protein
MKLVELLESLAPGDLVAIIGSPARTCYADLDDLWAVLSTLNSLGVIPCHAHRAPFDMHLQELCLRSDFFVVNVGPDDPGIAPYERIERVERLLHPDVKALLVFHAHGRPVEETDPNVCAYAESVGVPIVPVPRMHVKEK